MMSMMSEDAKAILLLCGHLGRASEAEPLAQQDYNQVVQWLKSHKLRPADLLVPEHVPILAKDTGIAEGRLTALLKRGVKLAFAVEGWNQSGIWVVCRSDPQYPEQYKRHLKEKAPPICSVSANDRCCNDVDWPSSVRATWTPTGRPLRVTWRRGVPGAACPLFLAGLEAWIRLRWRARWRLVGLPSASSRTRSCGEACRGKPETSWQIDAYS